MKKTTKKIRIRNGHLAGKQHPVTGVKFSKNGFPIFQSKYTLTLPKELYKSSNSKQFKHANKRLL
ncbi:HNH endonuclease (plasmid) [Bacillus sp. FJAT-52991]|uniref:HNH endonuclease n=1 Tax=Bacillus kandeliae TaxID=3129297 RepID=A0ABZ2NBL1_9BACI